MRYGKGGVILLLLAWEEAERVASLNRNSVATERFHMVYTGKDFFFCSTLCVLLFKHKIDVIGSHCQAIGYSL